MIKFISSEEYEKLTGNLDYWKARALEEERSKNFYKTLCEEEKSWHEFYKGKNAESISDYMFLMKKYQKLAEKINNEHQCDKNCFAEHVLPAIQRDYDKCNNSSNLIRHKFIEHWSDKLYDEYDFVSCICLINDKLAVKYR